MTDIKENTSGQSESREIKYRAWDLQLHIMGEVVELGMRDGSMLSMLYEGGQTYGNIKDYRIMQYTGLKDKNGVEIYEGDILQYYMGGKKMGGKVHYKDGSFWVTFYRTPTAIRTQIISAFLSDKRTSVIIGNIYENPELLSEK